MIFMTVLMVTSFFQWERANFDNYRTDSPQTECQKFVTMLKLVNFKSVKTNCK